eukprot:3078444-Amphidinium_carterae.1
MIGGCRRERALAFLPLKGLAPRGRWLLSVAAKAQKDRRASLRVGLFQIPFQHANHSLLVFSTTVPTVTIT